MLVKDYRGGVEFLGGEGGDLTVRKRDYLHNRDWAAEYVGS